MPNRYRKNTQSIIDKEMNDILSILNKKVGYEKFIKIEKCNGRLQYKFSYNDKKVRYNELYLKSSKGNLPTDIKLSKKSKKCDYVVYDEYNNEYSVEAKSLDSNMLSEMCCPSKRKNSMLSFQKYCDYNNVDPQQVFNEFLSNIIKLEKNFVDQLTQDKLFDYIVFHKNGKFIDDMAYTFSEFTSKYEFKLVIKPDAGGKNKCVYRRLTNIYVEK